MSPYDFRSLVPSREDDPDAVSLVSILFFALLFAAGMVVVEVMG